MTQAPGNLACHISQHSGSDLFGFLSSDASLALTHFLFSCYQFQWCARSICFGSISLSRNSLKFLPWICDYAHPVLPSSNRFQSSSLFVLRIFFYVLAQFSPNIPWHSLSPRCIPSLAMLALLASLTMLSYYSSLWLLSNTISFFCRGLYPQHHSRHHFLLSYPPAGFALH